MAQLTKKKKKKKNPKSKHGKENMTPEESKITTNNQQIRKLEKNGFMDTHNLPKLSHDDRENVSRTITGRLSQQHRHSQQRKAQDCMVSLLKSA